MEEKGDASIVAAGVSPAVEPGVSPGGKKQCSVKAAITNIVAFFRAAGRTPSTAGGYSCRYIT